MKSIRAAAVVVVFRLMPRGRRRAQRLHHLAASKVVFEGQSAFVQVVDAVDVVTRTGDGGGADGGAAGVSVMLESTAGAAINAAVGKPVLTGSRLTGRRRRRRRRRRGGRGCGGALVIVVMRSTVMSVIIRVTGGRRFGGRRRDF